MFPPGSCTGRLFTVLKLSLRTISDILWVWTAHGQPSLAAFMISFGIIDMDCARAAIARTKEYTLVQ